MSQSAKTLVSEAPKAGLKFLQLVCQRTVCPVLSRFPEEGEDWFLWRKERRLLPHPAFRGLRSMSLCRHHVGMRDGLGLQRIDIGVVDFFATGFGGLRLQGFREER